MIFFLPIQPVRSEGRWYIPQIILLFKNLPYQVWTLWPSSPQVMSFYLSQINSLMTCVDLSLLKVVCWLPDTPCSFLSFHLQDFLLAKFSSFSQTQLRFFLPSWSHDVWAHTASPASSYPSLMLPHTFWSFDRFGLLLFHVRLVCPAS